MFRPPCSVLKNKIDMERGDLGAVLTVVTSQMGYSNIALDGGSKLVCHDDSSEEPQYF